MSARTPIPAPVAEVLASSVLTGLDASLRRYRRAVIDSQRPEPGTWVLTGDQRPRFVRSVLDRAVDELAHIDKQRVAS